MRRIHQARGEVGLPIEGDDLPGSDYVGHLGFERARGAIKDQLLSDVRALVERRLRPGNLLVKTMAAPVTPWKVTVPSDLIPGMRAPTSNAAARSFADASGRRSRSPTRVNCSAEPGGPPSHLTNRLGELDRVGGQLAESRVQETELVLAVAQVGVADVQVRPGGDPMGSIAGRDESVADGGGQEAARTVSRGPGLRPAATITKLMSQFSSNV